MEKEIIVTADGRTIVDANQLFKNREVIDFVSAIREIHGERNAARPLSAKPRSQAGRVNRRLKLKSK